MAGAYPNYTNFIMENTNHYSITGIDIRNYKRVTSVQLALDPDDNLITIGGENGHGKSSTLDAIEAALCGPQRDVTNPVHEGQPGGGVIIQIPPYQVKRIYSPDGKPSLQVIHTGTLTEVPRPSQFLKELVGGLFVDPLHFIGLQPIEQRKLLADLLGLDMSTIDGQIEQAREEVKRLDQYQKGLVAKVEELPEHPDAPEAEVSVDEITKQLGDAIAFNASGSTLRAKADNIGNQIFARERELGAAEYEITRIKQQLAEAEQRRDAVKAGIEDSRLELAQAEKEANEFVGIDIEPLQAQLRDADATNRKVRDNAAKARARDEWTKAEEQMGQAAAKVKALENEKKEMLAAAKFPVDGLGFDAKGITLDGQPFAQASHAQQIRASMAIALMQRGKVAPILIKDASTIDKKMLRAIADIAKEYGAQVFAEVIANKEEDGSYDRECSFIIEEGRNALQVVKA